MSRSCERPFVYALGMVRVDCLEDRDGLRQVGDGHCQLGGLTTSEVAQM
jgi:hypothetical protein